MAVGEKVGARMVAKARNAMAARRKQQNSGDLAGRVEGTFMAAPINRNLLFDFKHDADLTPIPLFADSFGWVRLLNWVAHPLVFRFLRVFCIPDDSAGQRVGNSLFRFNQPTTIRLRPPALAAWHP